MSVIKITKEREIPTTTNYNNDLYVVSFYSAPRFIIVTLRNSHILDNIKCILHIK